MRVGIDTGDRLFRPRCVEVVEPAADLLFKVITLQGEQWVADRCECALPLYSMKLTRSGDVEPSARQKRRYKAAGRRGETCCHRFVQNVAGRNHSRKMNS